MPLRWNLYKQYKCQWFVRYLPLICAIFLQNMPLIWVSFNLVWLNLFVSQTFSPGSPFSSLTPTKKSFSRPKSAEVGCPLASFVNSCSLCIKILHFQTFHQNIFSNISPMHFSPALSWPFWFFSFAEEAKTVALNWAYSCYWWWKLQIFPGKIGNIC